MEIKYFCPHWGSGNLDFKEFITNVTKAGYDGIEMSLPSDHGEKSSILDAVKKHRLSLIAQHWETSTPDFKEHKKEYRSRLVNLATARPLFINSQTGKDFFSFEQNLELIQIASDVSNQYGVKIIHETHRGKFSFAAHITAEYLNRLPDLRIGLDISHWCNVAESYLQDQQAAIALAITRTDHIHARIGFPEGPQITDPRDPDWKEAVDIHTGWWKRIVEIRRKEDFPVFTITSEFGPFPYMTNIPFSGQPVANQWEINVYMMNMLKQLLFQDK
ncbi:MAG: sugar phosphate isomerase/epimerase [Bacteroidia bacterium]|nr:sugar phosphate isomerase/epimerase [Bacteroidia bacterium]